MKSPVRATYLAGLLVVIAAAGVLGLLAANANKAEAQSIMSAPACQCSAPTSITGFASRVAHCLCGGMSCVISEQSGPNPPSLMQCVR